MRGESVAEEKEVRWLQEGVRQHQPTALGLGLAYSHRELCRSTHLGHNTRHMYAMVQWVVLAIFPAASSRSTGFCGCAGPCEFCSSCNNGRLVPRCCASASRYLCAAARSQYSAASTRAASAASRLG